MINKEPEKALIKKLPYVFISRCYGRELNVRIQHLEDGYYEQLKRNLPGCVEISLQVECLARTSHLEHDFRKSHNSVNIEPENLATKSLNRYHGIYQRLHLQGG